MSEDRIYVALMEVKPLVGCQINPDEIAGAAVRCYVPAATKDDAINKVQGSLLKDRFRTVEIEWCVPFDSTDWEKPADPTGILLVEEAKRTGIVVYGEFHTWGHDE